MAREAPARNKVVYVKLKGTKQNETPEFIFREKKGADFEESKSNFVSGVIKSIEPASYQWPKDSGKWVFGFKIVMQDENESYSISLSYTWMSRTILNCLANIDNPGMISFEVFAGAKDSDGYPSVFVNVDEENCKWAWKFKELQEKVAYNNDVANYTELNEFFDMVITDTLQPKFSEWYNRMCVNGNFPAALSKNKPVAEEPNALDEAVKEQMESEHTVGKSTKASDVDVSSQLPDKHEGEAAYEPPAAVEEEPVDDLPF